MATDEFKRSLFHPNKATDSLTAAFGTVAAGVIVLAVPVPDSYTVNAVVGLAMIASPFALFPVLTGKYAEFHRRKECCFVDTTVAAAGSAEVEAAAESGQPAPEPASA